MAFWPCPPGLLTSDHLYHTTDPTPAFARGRYWWGAQPCCEWCQLWKRHYPEFLLGHHRSNLCLMFPDFFFPIVDMYHKTHDHFVRGWYQGHRDKFLIAREVESMSKQLWLISIMVERSPFFRHLVPKWQRIADELHMLSSEVQTSPPRYRYFNMPRNYFTNELMWPGPS